MGRSKGKGMRWDGLQKIAPEIVMSYGSMKRTARYWSSQRGSSLMYPRNATL